MRLKTKLLRAYYALILAVTPLFGVVLPASADPGNFFITYDGPSVAPGQTDVPVYIHLNSNGTDVGFAGCELDVSASDASFSHGQEDHSSFTSDFDGPNGDFDAGGAPDQRLFYTNDIPGVTAGSDLDVYVLFYDISASASGTVNMSFDTSDTNNCLIQDENATAFTTITGTSNSLDVSGVTVTESASSTDVVEGGATDTFDVVLDAEPASDVIIDITDDAQTNVSSSSLTFTNANWDTAQTVTVSAEDDSTIEGSHTGTISMAVNGSSDSLYTGLTISDVTVNVSDNDGVVVEFDNTSASDNENTGGNLPQLIVGGGDISGGGGEMITVDVTGGTATGGGDDYTFTDPTAISIPAADYTTPQTITITGLSIDGDTSVEPDETIIFGLTSPTSGIAIGNADGTDGVESTHTYTINNDDGLLVEFSNTSASDNENTGGNVPDLVVSGAVAAGTETIDVNIAGSSTANGTDYTFGGSTITIPAGDYTTVPGNVSIGLSINGDTTVEGDDTIDLTLSSPSGLSVGDADSAGGVESTHTYTITNDDQLTTELTSTTASDAEASGGNLPQVLVNGTTDVATSVTIDDQATGTATSGNDYSLTDPVNVTIPAGSYDGTTGTAVSIPLTINDDSLIESSETIDFDLTAPASDIVLADVDGTDGIESSHTYTITDDDQLYVEFDTTADSVNENAGYTPLLRVGGGIATSSASVDVTITGGTAGGSGDDYTFTSPTTVSIPVGDYSTPQTVSVSSFTVTGDTVEEPDETVIFGLASPSSIAIGDADGTNGTESVFTFTITDDDSASSDTDNDGIPNSTEDAGPNGGDANGDGTQDSAQSSVTSIVNGLTGEYTVLEITSGCNIIDNFDIETESSQSVQDGNYDYPYGLNDFTLTCASAGDSGTVTILLDQEYDVTGWVVRKLNRNSGAYSDLSSATFGTRDVGGTTVTTVTYSITDGSSLDEDGSANATIIDPVGIGNVLGELSETGMNVHGILIAGASIAALGLVLHRASGRYAYYRITR